MPVDVQVQAAKAESLRQLHRGPRILILVNAWDAASARVIEAAGLPALATSSAGVAYAYGYPDGQVISREEMLSAVSRIASAVNIPVTADMEAGYGSMPRDMKDFADELIIAGAAGLNLEDSGEPDALTEIPLQVEKIRALRAAATEAGVPLVINARTDALWDKNKKTEERLAEAVRRGRAYSEAGADSIFVVGASDRETIAALVREIPAPVNILAGPGVPSAKELEALGVRRVSVGSGPMRATMTLTRRIAEELLENGTYLNFTEGVISHAAANALFKKPL
ncbi:MAG: isocitrate lyase/PEP mutase family protein [Candidatus Acidiferrales bacterium]